MSLSMQSVDDFVEAHEVTDERQILAMACFIRVCEGSSNDVAELADVAHVKDARAWIEREGPASGSVRLLLRSQSADEVLVIERRDDIRAILKAGLPHDLVDPRLAREVRNMQLAAADCFHVRDDVEKARG